MMIILYNFIQGLALLLLWPILLITAMRPKYRTRFTDRLGYGLDRIPGRLSEKRQPRIWIHALSVGEVTSSLPLVSGLRDRYPDGLIIFSATTRAGAQTARNLLDKQVDHFVAFPLDLFFTVRRFIKKVAPDCFILIETDFWPNLLHQLDKNGIPSILVNGRTSSGSIVNYKRFDFFFSPLFSSFSHLCLQTETDRLNFLSLGLDEKQLHTLGNLKFDTSLVLDKAPENAIRQLIPKGSSVMVAGSTHEGEEEIVLSAFSRLRSHDPRLFLILAPRDIQRGPAVIKIALEYALSASLRSASSTEIKSDILILDTIGELSSCYPLALFAFIGGSLVASGGHNPIEAAVAGIPVLFGPHMEDFSEISQDLIQHRGAVEVGDGEELYRISRRWLEDSEQRQKSGRAAFSCVERQQGVVRRHIKLIETLL